MGTETMMTGQGNTGTAEGQGQGQAGEAAPAPAAVEGTQPAQQQQGEAAPAPTQGEQGDQAATGDKPEGGGEKGDEAKAGAPEKYEFTAPEGFEGALDQAALESFEPVARELGLSQEQADKLVKLHADSIQQGAKQQREAHATQVEAWQNELKNDPEFGGAKFDENLGHATKAVKQFGGDAFIEALETTGMGNHPAFVKVFSQIGKAMSEDKVVMGGQSQGPRDVAEIMYGKSN